MRAPATPEQIAEIKHGIESIGLGYWVTTTAKTLRIRDGVNPHIVTMVHATIDTLETISRRVANRLLRALASNTVLVYRNPGPLVLAAVRRKKQRELRLAQARVVQRCIAAGFDYYEEEKMIGFLHLWPAPIKSIFIDMTFTEEIRQWLYAIENPRDMYAEFLAGKKYKSHKAPASFVL